MSDDDRPINRRAFFRQGLRQVFKPLARAAEPLEQVIRQIGAMEDQAGGAPPPPRASSPTPLNPLGPVLRPPGAVPEPQFRDACSRCGECVRVCPVQCIRIDPNGLRGNGVPFIDVDAAACVMCDGLLCMHSCPTGALVPTPLADIDMGTAVWHPGSCLRTVAGEPCSVCVDVCPVGEVAIGLLGNAVQVKVDGCTGCGLCQNRCPTTPKSITVTPRPPPSHQQAATPRPRPR